MSAPNVARQHADWLSLVEVSGPFLSLPVLLRTFPQGLEPRDPARARALRDACAVWQDHPEAPGAQRAWLLHVLTHLLGYPPDLLAEGQRLPAGLEANLPELGETLRPDLALVGPAGSDTAGQAQLLIVSYPPGQALDRPVSGRHWKATPATRMMELLHGAGVPLGLVTNGEHWQLVYAPRGETTGYASWYASLWLDEAITLRAFHSLLGVRRFFGVAADSTLAALFRASADDQQEVTDQLGYQVREAVEVLVQAFDALDEDSGRRLLAGIAPATQYEAALTVMMRLVFLFYAEERGLLFLGKPLYDDNYAVSTLQEQLQAVADHFGEEVLERRSDAWARLLATARALHGGTGHQDLPLPAYGGSLFDPDRHPFLEGRASGTHWRTTPAAPLAVNNRVVLHLLNALQRLRLKGAANGTIETRRVSFRALGVEQIGHVYEGLLDHTAVRAAAPVLGIRGTRTKEPECPLGDLEARQAQGEAALIAFLAEETGRSASALRGELHGGSLLDDHRLRIACGHDEALLARLRPFAGLIRDDSFGRPLVVRTGAVYVTVGAHRRSTGTHYTPPSLTEPIVKHTLEPLIYAGPAEGWPREQWRLKSPAEIVALKVCDLAMGSGAFLVQTCRFLAARLVEAWERAEAQRPGEVLITPDGDFSAGSPTERLLPTEAAERLAIACRVVADRCLYGVDINPLAVEMAKLSLWLITVDPKRPFTFLDHAFKCGDSLLGVASLDELDRFYIDGTGQQRLSVHADHLHLAAAKRQALAAIPDNSLGEVAAKALLLAEAEESVLQVRLIADLVTGARLAAAGRKATRADDLLRTAAMLDLGSMEYQAETWLSGRHPFHWPLAFPEVWERGRPAREDAATQPHPGGFHAFVGNPPFMGGQKITGNLGTDYRTYLVTHLAGGARGSADLCAYFFLRAGALLRPGGGAGLLATNTIAQGDTREVGLDQLAGRDIAIPRAVPSRKWPGAASLEVAHVWLYKGDWHGPWAINDEPAAGITPYLTAPGAVSGPPQRLKANEDKSFQGSIVLGMGFVLEPAEAQALIERDPRNRDCLFPYLNGEDLNSRPDQSPSRWVINFQDWPLDRSAEGSWEDADDDQRKEWLRGGRVPRDYPWSDAADYPILLDIIRERAKPERDRLATGDVTAKDRARRWWQFARPTMRLYATIDGMERVLVFAQTSKTKYPAHVGAGTVYDQKLVVFAMNDYEHFGLLCSHIHYTWAIHQGSSLRTDPVYTPSDCFETFPFPNSLADLDPIGERYYAHRQSIMQSRQEGLTKTYNRFHDPAETAADIVELRRLHIEMDQAVAGAYGWHDLALGHGFHATKQGLRFTLAETARREVLDRLLRLNHARYAEEVAAGLHDKKPSKPPARRPRPVPTGAPVQPDLFDAVQPDLFDPPPASADGPAPLLAYLQAHPGWHGKDAILTATGYPAARWSAAIADLLARGQVERQGERRAARYRAAPEDP